MDEAKKNQEQAITNWPQASVHIVGWICGCATVIAVAYFIWG